MKLQSRVDQPRQLLRFSSDHRVVSLMLQVAVRIGERPLTPLRFRRVKLEQDSRKPSAARAVPLRAREMAVMMRVAFILAIDLDDRVVKFLVLSRGQGSATGMKSVGLSCGMYPASTLLVEGCREDVN